MRMIVIRICRPWGRGPAAARSALYGIVAAALLLTGFSAAAAEPDIARLLQTIDYIAVDYPEAVANGEIVNEAEYAEMQEFAGSAAASVAELDAAQDQAELVSMAAGLVGAIEAKDTPAAVFDAAVALRTKLLELYPVITPPARAPDLALGSRLYAEQCASCHGELGRGDGVAGAQLEPPPTDFTDRNRARTRSIFGLFSTITLGVDDTAMVPYAQLSDHQRWSLAFYVASLQNSQAALERGAALLASGDATFDIETAVTASENELVRQYPDADALLAYARATPAVMFTGNAPLDVAERLMGESLAAYESGDGEAAYDLALRAYLEGVELIEPTLNAIDARTVRSIERAMLEYRNGVRGDRSIDDVRVLANDVQDRLVDARRLLEGDGLSPALAFVSSFIILAREGFEAILIIAAMALVIGRSGDRTGLRALHAGWLAALAAGAATWATSNWLLTISGAAREVTEGATALLAAVILIWVGVWLHDQAHARDWTKMVGSQLSKALQARSLWWVFLLAFLAVYREAFEVILFYQALWSQVDTAEAGSALLGGAGLAVGALLIALWLIVKLGARLPVRQFFLVCSVTLVVLAVIFVGNGVAALQEAGRLPAHTIALPRIDWIGLYPTLEGAAAQLACAAVAAFLLWRPRRAATPPRAPSTS